MMKRFSITFAALALGTGIVLSQSSYLLESGRHSHTQTASNDTRGQVVMRKMPPDPPKPGDDRRPKRESLVLPFFTYAPSDHSRPA